MGHNLSPNLWTRKCEYIKPADGNRCGSNACKESNFCHKHGGNPKKRGTDSAITKSGRGAQGVKRVKLRERAAKAEQDTRLMELYTTTAIIEGMFQQLIDKYDDEDFSVNVTQLLKMYDDSLLAKSKKDWPTFFHLYEKIGDSLQSSQQEFLLLGEIRNTAKLRKELSDSQTKREIQLDQMIRAEDVKVWGRLVMGEIRDVLLNRIGSQQHATEIIQEIIGKLSKYDLGGDAGRTFTVTQQSPLPTVQDESE